jgi:Ca2+-binding EF-hand superfamily protein
LALLLVLNRTIIITVSILLAIFLPRAHSLAGLSDEELEAARKIFDAVDADGSGMIDVDELKEALGQSGREPTDAEVSLSFNTITPPSLTHVKR